MVDTFIGTIKINQQQCFYILSNICSGMAAYSGYCHLVEKFQSTRQNIIVYNRIRRINSVILITEMSGQCTDLLRLRNKSYRYLSKDPQRPLRSCKKSCQIIASIAS